MFAVTEVEVRSVYYELVMPFKMDYGYLNGPDNFLLFMDDTIYHRNRIAYVCLPG
jgi:hypothetical protein